MQSLGSPKLRGQLAKQLAESKARDKKTSLQSQVKGMWAGADRSEAKQTGKPQVIRRV